jgi:tyrosine phenol-lyase
MDVTAESIVDLYARRQSIRGLKMIYEPKYLRFFQARFEPLVAVESPAPACCTFGPGRELGTAEAH